MLTAALAQEIADENAAVTGLGILITDRDGHVIGSSDPLRIGTFHEASLDVVRTGQPASHTARQAAALRGVRPGLTLPILVGTDAVGTVGITGSPPKVRGFGPLVRRHTEILLRESAALRFQLMRERGIEDLVRDISTFDPDVIEPMFLLARARELGFSCVTPRTAVILGLDAKSPHSAGAIGSVEAARARPRAAQGQEVPALRSELVRLIRERLGQPDDIVAASTPGRFVVLHRVPLSDPRAADHALEAACAGIIETVRVRFKLTLRAGIGGTGASLTQLRPAVQDAADALRLGARVAPSKTIHPIRELRTYQLLSDAGQRSRSRLITGELTELRAQPDWAALRNTLITWCETGFRPIEAAAVLHIHRNTLLYRLAKIERITGRGVRDHAASITTYLACPADRIQES